MSQYPKLEKYLNTRRSEMSKEEYGDPPWKLISWTVLASKVGVPNQTLLNWSKGISVPSRPKDEENLARVFGDGVWIALSKLPPDMDYTLVRLYLQSRTNPDLKRIFDEAIKRAQEYEQSHT